MLHLQIMKHDVLHAASCGAHGVVLGMLTADGSIDTAQLLPFTELCAALGADPEQEHTDLLRYRQQLAVLFAS